MGVKSIIQFVVILLVRLSLVLAEDRCAYMINIPRLPKPELIEHEDFEGKTWNERPFVPAPERPDVCMGEYFAAESTQIIYMEEEIVGDVAIAKLNYDGSATPVINRPLMSGVFNMLGPELRRENNEWFLYITQRQDYETPNMQVYMLSIQIQGETLVAIISLQIVNIDDNPPIIHLLDTCVVKELEEPHLTSCTYEVTDEDGQISTSAMTFEINSDRNDNEIFYILGQNIPQEWKRMTMTLGLNKSLDFEANALHIFRVTAFDSLPNNHTVTIMVQVQNVEHRPPRWVEIFAVQQFDEKTAKNFTVRAIDGDTGIDKPIYYRLEADEDDEKYFDIKTIEGGREGAIFQVFPIDRDELERELFQVSLIAYKYDNTSFATTNNVVIIINDVNDQAPEPLQPVYSVNIDEETPQTLFFVEEFGFHDKDLGQHAQYKVHLESVNPPGAHEAFFIQPEIGYQRQTFIMGTTNHSMLDYEVPEFQFIELKVVATDMDKPEFVGVATVYINLTNWNDEIPIFENSIQTVSFKETEGEGYFVANVQAHDRDIGDRVVHSIMGTADNILRIEEDTGNIYVAVDDAFDYQRQSELLVQIRAEDTLGEPFHTVTSQLLIQLEDINNTPPTLRLPRGSPQVNENVPEGFPITQENQEITATDPDTTADLRFEIIWNTSYATKQGREARASEYHGCLDIETIYPDPERRGSAVGRLIVKEIRTNVTIDYEEFEVLYLTVRVVDNNTKIGQDYDELTYTITIVDMNDNAPQWVAGTLTQALRVRENSASNTIIGTVQATDIDGPLYNQVRYTIFPKEDTPENLVKIDFHSGQIEVDLNGAIDADIPPRYNLTYTVIASDKCSEEDINNCPPDTTSWNTEGDLSIQIIDTNNKIPIPKTDQFNTTVYIYENAKPGDEVVVVVSEDLDRDEMYHTVSYQINYPVSLRLRNFFSVELETGRVYVHYTTDEVLDRDGNEPTHRIFLNLFDNFYSEGDGNRNTGDTEVLVVLLDINDNAPLLPTRNQLSWSISENLERGSRLSPYIYASDRDEPNTDNSRVGYEILTLNIIDRNIEPPTLFTMIQIFESGNIYNVTGELETAVDLKGYWGTYDITIRAYDHGEPQLDSEENYELVIRPYNFYNPVFVFPRDGTTVRLARERAVSNGLLALASGEFLDRIHATDEDGLHAGSLSFEVTGDDEASTYFQVVNDVENQGTLMLKELFTENIREFQIRIRATDGGTEPGPLYTEVILNAVFVPTQGDPIFTTSTAAVGFVEHEVGLTEKHQLPLAEDLKNYLCDNDCHEIYYSIISGNDEGHFILDLLQNVLSLNTMLNRSESESHTLRIRASNSIDAPGSLDSSVLTVTVNVREANPRPFFQRQLYTAGISTLDSINRELLTIKATHSDGLPIKYSMNMESMTVDPSLEAVRDSAFMLHETSGVLTLNMQPTASMHGMFEFDVIATDSVNATDTAAVKIYLISSLNRVSFIFVNALEQVERHTDFIAQTFSTGFNMTCNIDQVLPATDPSGVIRDDVVEVRSHFIKNDAPVSTTIIEDLRSDTQLLRSIQTTLNTELLVLRDLVTDASPGLSADSGQLAVYALAGLSALLGLLCLVMVLVYVFRTRALNRRLQALSMTKYGSQDSGLNRLVLAAPGTNKHATEGSNPIWNEAIKAPDFDAISDQSDDSDLIGIENLPQFRNDYFPPGDDDSTQDMVDENQDPPVATHNNNFGFNPTPFSPEFANKPLRFMR